MSVLNTFITSANAKGLDTTNLVAYKNSIGTTGGWDSKILAGGFGGELQAFAKEQGIGHSKTDKEGAVVPSVTNPIILEMMKKIEAKEAAIKAEAIKAEEEKLMASLVAKMAALGIK